MNSSKSAALQYANKTQKSSRRRLEIKRLQSFNLTAMMKPEFETQYSKLSLTSTSSAESSDRCRREEGSSERKSGELVYGHVSMIGRRRVMEDAVTVAPPGWLAGEYYFFAAYDGHGGDKVAQACGERLHKCLEKHIEKAKKVLEEKHIEKAKKVLEEKHIEKAKKVLEEKLDWEKLMVECFSSMDEEFGENVSPDELEQMEAERNMGSTAVVVLVGKEEVVVANCGDSRAVLCRGGVALPLSSDHKPDRADERERIEGIGGKIINWNGWRVEGVLSTSRSLGDHYLKPYVTSEPEVKILRRSEYDEFIIIATDGLFDVVGNGAACEVVKRCLNRQRRRYKKSGASEAAAMLGELAIAKGSRDNITVIVVQFK